MGAFDACTSQAIIDKSIRCTGVT